jgi:cytochrome o ubiquinol oxidase subunit 2
MMLIVVPVFALTIHIAWKYRASNSKARYTPDWDHHGMLEAIWWGFPTAIIMVLSAIIWQSSHTLDPFRPIAAEKDTLTIQVVALQWKWLFIYPQQDIATVNYVKLPQNKPVRFDITADAPMNSFWIPQLGGQVYAMSGMRTSLHLLATKQGDFRGRSANLSGAGFADMQFVASSIATNDFDNWVQGVKHQTNRLSLTEYNRLAQPSRQNILASYASTDAGLQATIIDKYSGHDHNGTAQTMHDAMQGMTMGHQ